MASTPASTGPQLLVASDGRELPRDLLDTLRHEGYRITDGNAACTAPSGLKVSAQPSEDPRKGLSELAAASDLILIQLHPTDRQGSSGDSRPTDLCRWLRGCGITTPILALTDDNDVRRRIEILDAGADDCLAAPVQIAELLARLRAQLRRSAYGGSLRQSAGETLQLDDLRVDLATRTVSRAGCELRLTVREYDLLLCLFRGIGRVLSRDEIMHTVWGEDHFGDDNLLDVYIRYLRRKLEPPGLPTLIQTVRGVGFTLKPGPLRSSGQSSLHHDASPDPSPSVP